MGRCSASWVPQAMPPGDLRARQARLVLFVGAPLSPPPQNLGRQEGVKTQAHGTKTGSPSHVYWACPGVTSKPGPPWACRVPTGGRAAHSACLRSPGVVSCVVPNAE